MRTCVIKVRGNQSLEIFSKRKTRGFELWAVGLVKGVRSVLQHSLTHDDWERRLHYAKPGDLAWTDAAMSDIPEVRHAVALEQETLIMARGKFQDADSLTYDIANSLNLITIDRKAANLAKKAILGRWTDELASVAFSPDSKLELSLPSNRKHPFAMTMRVNGVAPNWWSLGGWTLHLMHMSDAQKCGQRTSVVQVDARELHVYSDRPDRIAHILHRQK